MSVLKSIFIFILVYGCVSFANANAEKPVLSKERIIFHTNFGDIAVALFPELAPKHEAQMFKMVRAGVYTGAEIYRVEPGFVAQVANYDIRPIPLSVAERASVQKIPAEFNQVHHRRGILSMARFDDPNSAEASFSFVFGQAAHLDGQYTAFGEVVAGFDVLDAIEHVTTDKNSAPIVGIKIESAEIVDAGSLGAMSLRPARPIGMPGEKSKTIFEIFAAVMFLTTVAIPILKTTVTHSSSIKPAEKPLHAIPLVPGTQK